MHELIIKIILDENFMLDSLDLVGNKKKSFCNKIESENVKNEVCRDGQTHRVHCFI